MNDLSVGLLVCLSSALWKNGRSDLDAVCHRRLDGSRDEAGSRVWGSVYGKGYFLGRIWNTPLSTWTYRAYVCYSAATRPSCQITLCRLVILCKSEDFISLEMQYLRVPQKQRVCIAIRHHKTSQICCHSYSALVGVQRIVINLSACVSVCVCLSVRKLISRTAVRMGTKF